MLEGLTAVLVLITGFYAWVTFRMLKANEKAVAAMQEQSRALTRPYVTCGIELQAERPIFQIVVANRGKTVANNLRLSLDRDFLQFRDERRNIRKFRLFQEPIDSLAPEESMRVDLAQGFVLLGNKANPEETPAVFEIAASYEGPHGSYHERRTVDLRPYRETTGPQDPVVTQLKGIREELKKQGEK